MLKGLPPPLEPDVERSYFHGVDGRDPETEPSAAWSGSVSLFEEPHQVSPPTCPVVPAAMPILFRPTSDLTERVVCSSQPNSHALKSDGLREQPNVRCRADISELWETESSVRFQAMSGRVNVVTSQQIASIDVRTGEVHVAGVPTSYDVYVNGTAATNNGVAAWCWRTNSPEEFVLAIDLKTNNILWSADKAEFPFKHVDAVYPMSNGDVVVLYSTAETTRICRRDGLTGAFQFDKPCPWSSDLNNSYVGREPTYRTTTPQLFHYDAHQECATFAVYEDTPASYRDATLETAELVTLSLKTGECTSHGKQNFSKHDHVRILKNGRVLVGREENGVEALVFSRSGACKRRPFSMPSSFDSDFWLKAKVNLTHGVGVSSQGLSFFKINDDGFASLHELKIPDLEVCDMAITRDNIAYVSTVLGFKDEAAGILNCRLTAYNVESGQALWHHDEPFLRTDLTETTAQIVINDDNSITWADHHHAIVLAN